MPPSGSRRALFTSGPATQVPADVESLERENDASVDALGERVGLLKNITAGIRGEVDEQRTVLDRMAQNMGGLGLGLGASAGKFRAVMRDPGSRTTFLAGLAAAVVLFALYLWLA